MFIIKAAKDVKRDDMMLTPDGSTIHVERVIDIRGTGDVRIEFSDDEWPDFECHGNQLLPVAEE